MAREEGSQGFCHAAGIVHVQQVRCLGQFVAEERIGVGHGLLEGIRQSAVQRGTVVRSADSPHPGIDGPGLVARAVTPESNPDDAADELDLPLALRDTRSVLPAIPTVVPELPEAQSYLSLPGWRHLCIPVFSADCVPLGFGR